MADTIHGGRTPPSDATSEDFPRGYGFRPAKTPLATIVWWATIEEDSSYTDAANEFWGLSFGIRADGTPTATLIGALDYATGPGAAGG